MRPFVRARWLSVLFVGFASFPFSLFGQSAPKRLSSWLLEQPVRPDAYPLGLSWRVPEEIAPQTLAKIQLLRSLKTAQSEVNVAPQGFARLIDWVSGLRATGRVPVAVADARWLEANPARDPILLPGHAVILPTRPTTVAVVTTEGEVCRVTHEAGREARAYLEICTPASVGSIDYAWIAQPDGRVQRFGIASWNRQVQDEPAPGAWIWGPSREKGIPSSLSERLISFLATQGPAQDMGQASETAAPEAPVLQLATALGQSRPRLASATSNDWGGAGLMQTPTARMAKAGQISFTLSRVNPYTSGNIFFQPFDWMEAGFRYTNIGNRLYGPADLSGDQQYKDKSIDVKLQLLNESAYLPEVAIGLRDVAGTGLFSSEYVVANKRSGNFDWSLGMGWGYLGGRGNIRNPLGSLSPSFYTRKADVGLGGNFGFGSYFRGPAALFGGVQYQSPWKNLILKAEYDGNNYQNEPLANNQRVSSPFNFGLVYRAAQWADLSLGVERGNTIMFGLTLHVQLDGLETPKVNDPPRIPVADRRPVKDPDWATTSRDIANQNDWHVSRIEQRARELRVTIDDGAAVYLGDRADKAAAVLHRDAPASVDRFVLSYRQRGADVVEHVIDRDAWVQQKTQPLPAHNWRQPVIAREPGSSPRDSTSTLYEKKLPRFESGLGFDFQQTLGGPDGFVLFQISAAERAKFRFRDDTWVQGTLRLGLIDNYDKFKFTGSSELPRVRTFLREYLTSSAVTMPNLQAQHVGKITQNQYYSVYGGYLESMFGGVGAEWLYKRTGSRLAFGVDVNAVRQRNFEQDFGFRDYKVTTGHGTVYWDTGWSDVQAKVSVGRYLAGDFGATLELSRTFRNGISVGAFATKTNVSATQFGEGSFDKGVYLSIPFDAMLTRSTNSVGYFVWKPLTRDGGAFLARENSLYGLTRARNERALWYEPAPRPNDYVIPADRREDWSPVPPGAEPYLQIPPRPEAAKFSPDSQGEMLLTEALHKQGFQDIRIDYDASQTMSVSVGNDILRPISRAVGRAARTVLRLAPLEARTISLTFADHREPLVTYDFVDLPLLDRYFSGSASRAKLANSIAIRYIDPSIREEDPVTLLADLDTTRTTRIPVDSLPGIRAAGRVVRDLGEAGRQAASTNWLKPGAVGTGLVLASSLLDKSGLKFSQKHQDSPWLKGFNRVGGALPLLGAVLVTAAALDPSDPRRARTGLTSLESAGVAFLASTGLKYITGRARPAAGLGANNFKPLSTQDSFPSRHAILAWAVATPFALEYDSNWRYGAAAIASLARVTKREHWVSDIVAGSLLGYGIGRIFWESSKPQSKGTPRAMVDLSGVTIGWDLD